MTFFKPCEPESSQNDERRILVAIVLAALAIRLFLMFWLKTYIITHDFAFGYEIGRVAKSLAEGAGFGSPFLDPSGPTALLPPLYPYFLAFIFKVFGTYSTNAAIITLVINCMVSAMTCIPIHFISKRLFGSDVGYVTAAVFAVHPTSIWHAVNTIWDTSLFTCLAMFLVDRMLALPRVLTYKNAALCGIFIGLIVLLKTVILAFFPFAMIWVFFQKVLTWKERTAHIMLMCVTLGLTLSPWLLRNYLVFDRVMLRSNFGLELRLENNSKIWHAFEATGDYRLLMREHPTISQEQFLVYKCLGEMNYMRLCLDDSTTFIRENPYKYVKATWRRVCSFWFGEWEKNEWKGNLRIPFSLSGLKKLSLILPLPFALIGIFLAISRKKSVWLLIAYLAFSPMVYYITHVSSRLRYPIEPVILIFAVYGLWGMRREA